MKGAGSRFGDNLCADCAKSEILANLPDVGSNNQFTNTKITKLNTQIYGKFLIKALFKWVNTNPFVAVDDV